MGFQFNPSPSFDLQMHILDLYSIGPMYFHCISILQGDYISLSLKDQQKYMLVYIKCPPSIVNTYLVPPMTPCSIF